MVAADNDDAGTVAADACGQRWAVSGRHVRIAMPPERGADLNDTARAAA